jgi:hypothetical protein
MKLDSAVLYFFHDEMEKRAFKVVGGVARARKPLLAPLLGTAAKVTTDAHRIAPEVAQMGAAKGWLQGAAHGLNSASNTIAGRFASMML